MHSKPGPHGGKMGEINDFSSSWSIAKKHLGTPKKRVFKTIKKYMEIRKIRGENVMIVRLEFEL